jgi:hypothetical protein
MWRKIVLVTASTLTVVVLTVASLFLAGPVKGLYYRTFKRPEITKSNFVDTLSSVPSLAAEQRKHFIAAWNDGSNYGLHIIRRTIEGDPVGLWLITNKKQVSLIIDYTHDPWSYRKYYIEHPSSVEYDTVKNGSIRCILGSKTIIPF